MNKYILIGMLSLGIAACGGSQENTNTTEPVKSMVDTVAMQKEAKMAAGKLVYEKVCQACHQADGKGLPKMYPPLAHSDYLVADIPRAIAGVANGLNGEITVNGEKYNLVMPKAALTDVEIADAFTYVLHTFTDKGRIVLAAEVAAVRK